MSGDRLAQIEEHARWAADRDIGNVAVEPADVLALVEIAKAARELSAANPTLGGKFGTLRSALARLDSGATEGHA